MKWFLKIEGKGLNMNNINDLPNEILEQLPNEILEEIKNGNTFVNTVGINTKYQDIYNSLSLLDKELCKHSFVVCFIMKICFFHNLLEINTKTKGMLDFSMEMFFSIEEYKNLSRKKKLKTLKGFKLFNKNNNQFKIPIEQISMETVYYKIDNDIFDLDYIVENNCE